MGVPKKYNLEPYREEIQEKLTAAWTYPRILEWLKEEMEEAPAMSTLRRTLDTWGMMSLKQQNRPDDRSGIMIDTIDTLVHRHGLYSNKAITNRLNEMGFHSSPIQVRNIRLERGWNLRHLTVEDQDLAWQRTRELCWKAIEEGPAREWGRGHLQVHLRLEYN